MNDEELKALIGKPVDDAAAAPVEEPPAPEPVAASPDRGPDGKFTARATETAPDPATPPQAPLTEKETVGFYKAMQEERDKRQALERKLASLEAAKPAADPPSRDQQVEAAIYGQKLTVSRKFAEREHGKDAIASVHDWALAKCDADPAFNDHMRSSDDPYEAAMQAYNREQILAGVTSADDVAQFKAWQAAKAADPASPPATQTPQTPLPRSLATAPGNGAAGKPHVPVGEGLAYASVIQG